MGKIRVGTKDSEVRRGDCVTSAPAAGYPQPVSSDTDRKRGSRPVAVAALALMVIGACSLPTPKRPTRESHRIQPKRYELPKRISGFEIFAPVGNLSVRPSEDSFVEKRLSVSAENRVNAEKIAERCNLTIETTPDGMARGVLHGPKDCPIDRLAADTIVALPARKRLKLRTVAGIINTVGFHAETADLRTRDGALLVGSVDKSLLFETRGGRIEVRGGFQSASGRSAEGSLVVLSCPEDGRLEFRSTSGSARITVPAAFEVTFRTRHGQLHSEIEDALAVVDSREEPGGWTVRVLRVGDEGVPRCDIYVESETGDLTLLERAKPQ